MPNCDRSGFALYKVASKTMNLACGAGVGVGAGAGVGAGVGVGTADGAVAGATVTTRWTLQPARVKNVSAEKPTRTTVPSRDQMSVRLVVRESPPGSPEKDVSNDSLVRTAIRLLSGNILFFTSLTLTELCVVDRVLAALWSLTLLLFRHAADPGTWPQSRTLSPYNAEEMQHRRSCIQGCGQVSRAAGRKRQMPCA